MTLCPRRECLDFDIRLKAVAVTGKATRLSRQGWAGNVFEPKGIGSSRLIFKFGSCCAIYDLGKRKGLAIPTNFHAMGIPHYEQSDLYGKACLTQLLLASHVRPQNRS